MAVDLRSKSIKEIETLIANHERVGKTQAPLYLATVEERARRKAGEYDVTQTMSIIAAVARQRHFISYGQIAAKYGFPAVRANITVPKHLEDVNARAQALGLPMLSAIVVSKDHVADGKMEPATLAAFCKSAERLGFVVEDPAKFLKQQQDAVFAAADEGRLV